MDYKEKILQIARMNPVLPNDIAKALGTNTIMASAMLSEMSSKGILKVSSIKVGSSPLYYPPSDGHKLQNYEKHLNEKDRQTVEILREKKVLKDSELDPLTRVSLRQVKDFAVPLEVLFDNQKEIFWKWYLLQDAEAEHLIRESLQKKEQKAEQKTEALVQEELPIAKEDNQLKPKEIKGKKVSQRKKPSAKEIPKEQLTDYFAGKNIKVIENIEEKKAGKSFIIQFDSALGLLDYYCEVVFKKKVSETDLNNAFVNGQLRKLPVIFFSTGELTKPAAEALKKLKSITFRQINGR